MESSPILEIKDLYKSFGKLKAVNGASFSVNQGTCFGLLGPNGAGKSTTIECIEKIIQEDSGEILYKGKKDYPFFLEELGIQFQETALPPKITVKETLKFFKGLYQKSTNLKELIDRCQLTDFINQYHDKISGGQRQRLLLAVALIHKPELLLLDEPTTGLDPQSRRNLWSLINQIKSEGKTIILTTHYMDEAFELCDTIGIMDHGKIISMGAPADLLAQHFKAVFIQIPLKSLKAEDLQKIKGQSRDVIFHREKFLEIQTHNINETMAFLALEKIDLSGMTIRQGNLEDLFLHLTGKELRS